MFDQLLKIILGKYLLAAIFSVFAVSISAGEFSKTQGDYTVYYNVFNSTFISQKVARQYQLVRSPESFLLNISIRKKQADGSEQEHPAKVKAYTNDLMRHHQLSFREIKEPGAIYYLADVPVKYTETLKFHISVMPLNSQEQIDIEFHRKVMPDK